MAIPHVAKSAEQVSALVSGLPHELRERWRILVLQAFVDDCQSDRVYMLCGYLSTVEKWQKFSQDWQLKLDAPPKISYFKSYEAAALKREFAGWAVSDRDAKVRELTLVINTHVEKRLECWVDQNSYNKVVKPFARTIRVPRTADRKERKAPDLLKDPYFLCFYGIVLACYSRLEEDGQLQQVDFVFDQQGPIGDHARDYWKEMQKEAPDRYRALMTNPPVFRDDKFFLPLQAADLYAGHTLRRIEKRASNAEKTAIETLRKVPLVAKRWNESALTEFVPLLR